MPVIPTFVKGWGEPSGPEVQDHLEILNKFKANLAYMKSYVKHKQNTKRHKLAQENM